MIKSIKVRTSKDINMYKDNIFPIKDLQVQKNKIETIALTTTAFENLLLAEQDLIKEGFVNGKAKDLYCEVHHLIDLAILDQDSKLDLIKALKDGDIAAKKRILKQLEEL